MFKKLIRPIFIIIFLFSSLFASVQEEPFNFHFFLYAALLAFLLFGTLYSSYRFTSDDSRDIINKWLKVQR